MPSSITYSDHSYGAVCSVRAAFVNDGQALPSALPGPFVYRMPQPSDPVSDVLYRVAVLTDFTGVAVSRVAALRGERGLSGDFTALQATPDLASSLFYFSPSVVLTAGSLPELQGKCSALEQRVENLINAYAAYVRTQTALVETTFPLYNTALVTAAKNKYYAAVAAEEAAVAATAAAAAAETLAKALRDAAQTTVTSLTSIRDALTTMRATTTPLIAAYEDLYSGSLGVLSTLALANSGLAATFQVKVTNANGDAAAITSAEEFALTSITSSLAAATTALTQKNTAVTTAAAATAAATLAQSNATVAAATARAELLVVCPVFTD
jgi:hypothetical protein